jgi:hypothetical protein
MPADVAARSRCVSLRRYATSSSAAASRSDSARSAGSAGDADGSSAAEGLARFEGEEESPSAAKR